MTGNVCMHTKSLQLCPTQWHCMDCSRPGSSVHGILQARILQWVAMPSSGDLPEPGIELRSLVSSLAGGFFTISTTWKPNDREWDLPKTETIAWFFDVSTHPPAQGFGKFNMKSLPARLGTWWEGALDSYHRNTIFLCPLSEAFPQKNQRSQA